MVVTVLCCVIRAVRLFGWRLSVSAGVCAGAGEGAVHVRVSGVRDCVCVHVRVRVRVPVPVRVRVRVCMREREETLTSSTPCNQGSQRRQTPFAASGRANDTLA